jgi:D-inositol-3-phosphate glycosyltransferase
MKIVIFVSYTFPYIGSGIGNVALIQAEHLAKLGHSVTLVSSNVPNTKLEFIKNNVNHIKLPALTFLEKFNVPVPLFIFNLKVIKEIRDADIIYVHDIMYPSSFLATLLTMIYRKKLFVTVHVTHVSYTSILLNLIETAISNTIGIFILACAKKVIVINNNFKKDQLLKKFEHKLVYLPNGVDSKLFKPICKGSKEKLKLKYNLPTNKPIVLFVGRLVPKKGYDILLKANDSKYFIVFVGKGRVPEYNENDKNVIFLGHRTQEELSELYQLADVFILPSHSEGFPLSVQEAMSSGLPIILSDLKLYKNANFDKNLVIYVDRTPSSIKNLLIKIFNNPTTLYKMSDYSLKQSRQCSTWEANVSNLLKIYKEA